MSLSGDIRTFPLPAVGRMVHAEKKTGVLKVTHGNHYARIYFKNGEIVFIDSDLAEDVSLGSLLKTSNLVSSDAIERAFAVARETGKRLGVILVEKGHISQKNLVNMLQHQFKEVVARVLAWTDGVFTYSDGLADHIEDIRLEIDPVRLVAEAEKWKGYRDLIPNDQHIFEIRERTFQPDALSGEGLSRVMLLINGKRTVAEIIAETGLSRLAVYRTLSALAAQGVIGSAGTENGEEDPTRSNENITIQFYVNVISQIIQTLSEELGARKAALILEKSIQRGPLFGDFRPNASAGTTLAWIRDQLMTQGQKGVRHDLVHAFNQLVIHLLREQYEILGFITVKQTINRLIVALERARSEEKLLAESVIRMLSPYGEDEALLRGTKMPPASAEPGQIQRPGVRRSMPSGLEFLGGAAIIAFYSQVIHLLIDDLEKEIGMKAYDLFQDIVKRSDYFETFFSRFDLKDTVSKNVGRVREHIQNQGRNIGKQQVIFAFQQVLLALLQAENRLLGNTATLESIKKLEGYVHHPAQNKYKPLADLLVPALKNVMARSGS